MWRAVSSQRNSGKALGAMCLLYLWQAVNSTETLPNNLNFKRETCNIGKYMKLE